MRAMFFLCGLLVLTHAFSVAAQPSTPSDSAESEVEKKPTQGDVAEERTSEPEKPPTASEASAGAPDAGSGEPPATTPEGAPVPPVANADAGVDKPSTAPDSVSDEPGVETAEEGAPEVVVEVIELPLEDAALGSIVDVGGEAADAEDVGPVVDVVVAGTRVARTAGSAHVIKTSQLERFEYDDPQAVLLQVPGVNIRQEDGLGLRPNISLRGANPDRSKKVTLMEDGVLFGPAPYSAPAAYYFPLMTRMTNMRVIKGPGTVAFGPQTVGGAIDMITRGIPTSTDAALDLAFGQFGYQKAHGRFGASDAQNGFLIEGVRIHSDGFKDLDGGGDTGFSRNEWMAKASHVLDPTASATHTFTLKAGYSDEASNETYLGLTDADFAANPDRRYPASALDRMTYHRTSFALSHVFESPSDRLTLTTTAYRHDFSREWRKFNGFRGAAVADVLGNPDSPLNRELLGVLRGEADSATGVDTVLVGPNARTFVSQGVQSRLDVEATTGPIRHRLEAGLRLHYDSIRREHSQSGYLMTGGDLVPDGLASEVTTANEAWTLAVAAHVVDSMTWGDLTVSPGVRLEVIRSQLDDMLSGQSSSASVVAPLPGVGVFYSLTDTFGLLAGAYRGFSPPPAGDSEPEQSVNYEVGGRFADGPARAELIGFFNDYSNLTNVCTFSNGCADADLDSQSDAGSAHIYGVEAYAEYAPRIEAFSFPLSAAYTYTRARFRHSFISSDPVFGAVETGDFLPYIPRHQLGATASMVHTRGKLSLGLTYVAPMREVSGTVPLESSLSTERLLVLDVSAGVKPLEGIEIYANLRNVFDDRAIVAHRPFGARPNAPRWFQIGVKGEL